MTNNQASNGTQLNKTSPKNSTERAWKVVINPTEFTEIERKHLIDRGAGYYHSEGGFDDDRIVSDAVLFVEDALDLLDVPELRKRIKSGKTLREGLPYSTLINQPARLSFLMGLGSVLVREMEAIKDDSRKPKIHEHVRKLYLRYIFTATYHSDHRQTIQNSMGETVYSRENEDEFGPPVGRPVEGITRLDGYGDQLFYKIPLVHANRNCEARVNNDPNEPLTSVIRGPYVYVPVEDIRTRYREYFQGRHNVARSLERLVRKPIPEEHLETLAGRFERADNAVQRKIETGQNQYLFKERQYPVELKAILIAVDNANPKLAKLGEPLSTEQIKQALDMHGERTDQTWIQNVQDRLETKSAVGGKMSHWARDENQPHVSRHNDNRDNLTRFVLEYAPGNFKRIDVSEISDLIEFPCMKNLHESLLESNPVRWELYSFVRYLFELNADITVEDIHNWFEQYPWYEQEVTDYQVRYEKRELIQGQRPFPISCNNSNDDWASHCIGMENCDYSLYQSIELRPDVYDRLGEK